MIFANEQILVTTFTYAYNIIVYHGTRARYGRKWVWIPHSLTSCATIYFSIIFSILLRTMNNSSNLTESFKDIAIWLRVVNGVVLSLFLLFSIVGNATVILLTIFHKNLHYRSIVVSLGLVAADSLVALEWNLLGLVSTIAGEWPLGDVACTGFGTMLLCVLEVRWLEIAVVTFDRFFIILSPFNYYKYSKPLQVVLTILAWIVPVIIITTPAALEFGTYTFRLTLATCFIDCLGNTPCYAFYFGGFGGFVVVGGVIPTVLYSIMYCIGRRKRSSMKHALGTQEVETETQEVETESSTISSADSLGGSATQSNTVSRSNNTRLKAQDRRALITFFIIFVTLLVTQIPIYITSGALRATDIFDDIPLWVHFVAMYIFLLSPVLTPLVIMRNKDFRSVILSIVKRSTTIPMVTNTQIQQFRRNSSLGMSVHSINGSQIDILSGSRYSLPHLTGINGSVPNCIQTVVEEDSQENS